MSSYYSTLQNSGNSGEEETEGMGEKGQRKPRERDSLKQLKIAHMSSQKLKQHAQGLHRSALGPLHIHYSSQFSSSMGILSV